MLNLVTARSPVFNAMFEHEMEESKKVRKYGLKANIEFV